MGSLRILLHIALRMTSFMGNLFQTCLWDETDLNELIVGTIVSDPEKAIISQSFLEANRDTLREFLIRSDRICEEIVLYNAFFR